MKDARGVNASGVDDFQAACILFSTAELPFFLIRKPQRYSFEVQSCHFLSGPMIPASMSQCVATNTFRVAGKSGVKRPTAYVILYGLQERGFIEVIPKGTTTLYQAVDPEVLHARFQERVKAFGSALPELRSILNSAPGKPRVRFYEGKKSILALYENEIFRAHEIVAIVNIKALRQVFSHQEINEMLHILKAGGGTIRELIADSDESCEYLKEKNRLQLGASKFLSVSLHFDIDMLVYSDTVTIISPKPLIAVVIEDAAISSAQHQLLESLWTSTV